jgi:Sec-independent protein translocase protein TatA
MGFLGFWDFVVIILVLVLIFGTRRFGRAFRSLKQGGKGFTQELRGKDELPPPPPPEP